MSGICALAFCLAGCGVWLDIPDNPRWVADAAAPTSEPALPSVSSASVVEGQPMPVNGPVGAPAESTLPNTPGSDSADPASVTDPIDAGAALADPAPEDPAPPADPAPEDPAPPADPALAEPAPPAMDVPQPPRCRGVESTGPNERCYLAVSSSLSWSDARRNCRARGDGWDLAAIRSNAINRFIGSMLVDEAWIGASDAANEGEWVWVNDGTPFWNGTGATGRAVNRAYENWNWDEPNGGVNTNCTRLVTTTSGAPNGSPAWADLECEDLRPSVCEGPPR